MDHSDADSSRSPGRPTLHYSEKRPKSRSDTVAPARRTARPPRNLIRTDECVSDYNDKSKLLVPKKDLRSKG